MHSSILGVVGSFYITDRGTTLEPTPHTHTHNMDWVHEHKQSPEYHLPQRQQLNLKQTIHM